MLTRILHNSEPFQSFCNELELDSHDRNVATGAQEFCEQKSTPLWRSKIMRRLQKHLVNTAVGFTKSVSKK